MTHKKVATEITGRRYFTELGGPSLTRQEFKDECSIERIMANYKQTGVILHGNQKTPTYDDFSQVVTFQEAQNISIKATEAFNALPSHVRTRFENDPGQFVDFAVNPDNYDQMVSMGLLPKPPAPAKQETAPAETKKAKTPDRAPQTRREPPDPEVPFMD